MKSTYKYIITTIIMLIIFVFAMYITGKIPKKAIEKNIKNSVNDVVDYPFWREAMTDAIMLEMAYRHDSDNSLKASLENITISNYKDGLDPYYGYDGQEAYKSDFYDDILNEDGSQKYIYEYQYGRYWHGYMILLRPLLAIFNYNQICLIFAGVAWILCIWLLVLVKSKLGLKYMFITLFYIFSMGYFTMILSISLLPTLLIMIIASIIILKFKEKIKDIPYFFFIVGGITTYFCWFNFTLLTLGLPLLFYYMLEKDENNFSLKLFIKIVIMYFIGRGIFLIAKWIIVDLICDTNIIKDAFGQVFYRLSNTTYMHTKTNFVIATFKNIIYYSPAIIIVYMYLFYKSFCCKICNEKTLEKLSKKEKIIYILIALIPFGLYIGVVNYSFIHAPTYTHRLLMLTLFSITVMFEKKFEIEYKKKDCEENERKK